MIWKQLLSGIFSGENGCKKIGENLFEETIAREAVANLRKIEPDEVCISDLAFAMVIINYFFQVSI